MYTLNDNPQELSSWIKKEVLFKREIKLKNRGADVKRIQEWLCLHKHGIMIDEDFGPITERAVKRYQEHNNLRKTGKVNRQTFDALVSPMLQLLKRKPNRGQLLNHSVVSHAQAHLAVHPVEIGGQNRGPWVRLYMKGHEGKAFPWCAGFVSFLLQQACESTDSRMPIKGSFSCDLLASHAVSKNRFIHERDYSSVAAGSIFLNRRTVGDWTHTGIVIGSDADEIVTIEGNTNDDGDREGYEVCTRHRNLKKRDFIRLE